MFDARIAMATERNRFFLDEGVLGVLTRDDRSHDGTTNAEQAGSHMSADPLAPPTFVITAEQYNRMARIMEKKTPVRVRVSLKAQASDADVNSANIVGEIPGGKKADEVVMIGAHFDSWHAGTGATDNGAGSAVMIEVMRILKTLNLTMDRTVRIGLWSGEEEGLYGSEVLRQAALRRSQNHEAYCRSTLNSRAISISITAAARFVACICRGTTPCVRYLRAWLAPFRDEGATTITIKNTGGTDHLSFDAVGLPGFQFIQDPLDYGSVTHHSSMDTYDHAVASDLMEASAVIAAVVYQAANSPEMLPRK